MPTGANPDIKFVGASHRGNLLFNALIGCFPEMNGSFPQSNRCLKGWQKIMPGGERGPLPLEAAWYGALKRPAWTDALLGHYDPLLARAGTAF